MAGDDDLMDVDLGGGEPAPEPAGGEPEEDGSFDGPVGQRGEQPAETQQAPAAAPPQGYQAHPLDPLLQRLPIGLQRQIANGTLSREDAVVRHYQGYVNNVSRVNEENARQRRENQALAGRVEQLVKHLSDTLGLALPGSEPAAPPTEVQALEQKVDAYLQSAEETRIDHVVDQTQSYVQQDVQAILQQEPEYHAAEEFVVNSMLQHTQGQLRQALAQFGLTRDPNLLANFSPEYLQQVIDGQMDEETLITLTAIERNMDVAAQTMMRHHQNRTSIAQDILAVARRMGWQPTREGGAPMQPRAGQQPVYQPPAPARRDPGLDRVRRTMTHQVAPAGTVQGVNGRDLAHRIATMNQEDFDRMLDESGDPEAAMAQLLKLGAV